ncbi:MAG: HEAT repeat domain-containing protein [Anaerolineae bacterium]|nr:HEAT repeat domain-containing protein [Anaerolineae bacterium]
MWTWARRASWQRRDDFDFPIIEPSLRLALDDDTEAGRQVESVVAALRERPQILLLGEPGAGKTTTLYRLLVDQAEMRVRDARAAVPVYLQLGAWPEGLTNLWGYIKRHAPVEEWQGNGLLLLLDGLNEMAAADREARLDSIHAFLREYDRAQVIATCRKADYRDALELDLPRLIVQPMNDDQIQRFLAGYLHDDSSARTLWDELQHGYGLPRERALLHLARNPYLLSILVVIYCKQQALPYQLGVLFRSFVDVLWDRETRRNNTRGFTRQELEHGLGMLAYAMIDEKRGTSVGVEWAADKVNLAVGSRGRVLLSLAHDASLVEMSEPVRFMHQLVQEYFAALVFRNEDDFAHLLEDWSEWKDALCMFASIGEQECQQVVDTCIAALESRRWEIRHGAAYTLDEIWDVRAVEPLIATLLGDPNYEVRRGAAWALGEIGAQLEDTQLRARIVQSLVAAIEDPEEFVQEAVVAAIGEIPDIGVGAVDQLVSMLGSPNEDIRRRSANALGSHPKHKRRDTLDCCSG